MQRNESVERGADPGAPARRVAAAIKQLRIVQEDVGDEREELGDRVEAAIEGAEAARRLLSDGPSR